MTSFLKMHGLGNDFAVFDGRIFPVPITAAMARAIADRKRGIGCDQVIVMEKGQNGAAAFMRIFNADGSEVESCGNAAHGC
jgi:diaminopimelate epimerase